LLGLPITQIASAVAIGIALAVWHPNANGTAKWDHDEKEHRLRAVTTGIERKPAVDDLTECDEPTGHSPVHTPPVAVEPSATLSKATPFGEPRGR
jgi:hypothetical protein